MGRITLAVSLCLLTLMAGCSGKLTRRQAKRQIDAMLKPHSVGKQKQTIPGDVPGFTIPEMDESTIDPVILSNHQAYGDLVDESDLHRFPDSSEFLLNALASMGYITVDHDGPTDDRSGGVTLHYAHSRTVRLTPKVGTASTSTNGVNYSSGFDCYPIPVTQCNIPSLFDIDELHYIITGIVQDNIHATVDISIPWKLTPFGRELKPYAEKVQAEANTVSMENDSYYTYATLYSWEHLLNTHEDSGASPAMIRFQKFDDGWRIVDQNCKSEQDLQ